MLPPPKKKKTIDVPISICLIAKNERKNIPILHKSLEPILGHPDDEVILVDTGSTDNTVEVAKRKGWKVFLHPELADMSLDAELRKYLPDFDRQDQALTHAHFKGGLMRSFAEARNLSFSYAKNDACLWLDLDDTLVNPGHLRPSVDQLFAEGQPATALMLLYEYAKDDTDNQTITQLWRERVVSKRSFYWKGACHEVLIPKEGCEHKIRMAKADNFPTKVLHRYHKPSCFSDVRNYLIMRRDEDEQHDPRTLFYLGNSCRGMERNREAVNYYLSFCEESGSKDDVHCARLSAATCLNRLGRHWKAMEQCWEAIRCDPEDPRGYYFLADCWFHIGHYRNCLIFIKLGDNFSSPKTMHAVDPTTLGFHPARLGVMSARELNETELAVHYARRALEERPDLPAAQQGLDDTERWASSQKMSETTAALLQRSKDPIEAAKLLPMSPHMLLQGIGVPEDALDDTTGTNITFFCGHSADHWGPPEVMGGKGIGASEKMVYEAARALAKRGYRVFVYCTLPTNGDEGVYEGVHWKFKGTFNPKIKRDHLVVWRMPQIVDQIPFNADHIHVWMHDMSHDSVWTEPILARLDKVWFLSKWQRDLHPSVPEELVFYTRNGIDLEKHLYDGREKKKHIVFCSSPDRGFQRAINVFEDSGLHEDGYELHLYYGFGKTWRHMAAEQGWGHVVELKKDMRQYEYEDQCLELVANTPGVVFKGSVDWATMAEAQKDAEIWLYPTNFGEISCVAAMEAMAAGCVCVATQHAALAETMAGYPAWYNLSQHAQKDWGDALRIASKRSNQWPDVKMRSQTAAKFDIETLVDDWVGLFNEHSVEDSEAGTPVGCTPAGVVGVAEGGEDGQHQEGS